MINLLKKRVKTLVELARQCRLFYQAPKQYNEQLANKQFNNQSLPLLQLLHDKLNHLINWQADDIKDNY